MDEPQSVEKPGGAAACSRSDAGVACEGLQAAALHHCQPGVRDGLTVLLKVAGALSVPVDELLAPPRAKVRKWTSADVSTQSRGQGVTLRPLVPEPTPDEMLSIMDFQPRATLRGMPHLPGTREYFTCLEGVVAISVDGNRFELERGDVLAFPGNVRHSYENPHATRAAVVGVVIVAVASSAGAHPAHSGHYDSAALLRGPPFGRRRTLGRARGRRSPVIGQSSSSRARTHSASASSCTR